MTVRFETRGTGPGPVRTFADDTADIQRANPVDSLDWPDYVDALAARLSPSGRRRRRRVSRSPARPSAAPGPAAGRSRGTITAPASTSSRPGPVAGADRSAGHPRRHRNRHAVAAVPSHPVDHRGARVARTQRLEHEPRARPRRRTRPSPPRRRPGRPRRCPPAARRRSAARRGTAAPWRPAARNGRRRQRRPQRRRSRRTDVATLCRPSGCQTVPARLTSTPRPSARRAGGHRQRVAQILRAVRVRAHRRCAVRR